MVPLPCTAEIVRPAEADRPIPQFCLDLAVLGQTALNCISDLGCSPGECGVVVRAANYGDVWAGGHLVKAGWQDSVVLEVADGAEEAGGDVALGSPRMGSKIST